MGSALNEYRPGESEYGKVKEPLKVTFLRSGLTGESVRVIFAVKVELLLALVMFTFVELERMPTLWETTNVKVTVGLA